MLKDLLMGGCGNYTTKMSSNWDILQDLVQSNKILFPRVEFCKVESDRDGICWQISEELTCGGILIQRSVITKRRNTIKDDFGLLGLSSINLADKSVILTEGVSDYFTAKLLEPNRNVIGVTTLSGSQTAKKILITLFDNFLICADNDATAVKNTGINNAINFKRYLNSQGKSVVIFTPQVGFKDITDNFVFNLKFNSVRD